MDRNTTEPTVAAAAQNNTQNIQNSQSSPGTGNIKEAVCVNASRVYDSCSSRQ